MSQSIFFIYLSCKPVSLTFFKSSFFRSVTFDMIKAWNTYLFYKFFCYIIRIEVDGKYLNNMLERNCLKTVVQPEFSSSHCHFSLPISRAINY